MLQIAERRGGASAQMTPPRAAHAWAQRTHPGRSEASQEEQRPLTRRRKGVLKSTSATVMCAWLGCAAGEELSENCRGRSSGAASRSSASGGAALGKSLSTCTRDAASRPAAAAARTARTLRDAAADTVRTPADAAADEARKHLH